MCTVSTSVHVITGCFKKKVAPLKLFGIFALWLSICMKFCRFVWNSQPHISTNFCRFILIVHQMALIFPRVPIVFTLSKFWVWPIHPENENAASRKWRHIFVIVCFSVWYCKQSITVWFLLVTFDIVLKLGRAWQWENYLKTTNSACRRCGRSPSPMGGLCRTAEPVWMTQL